MGWYRTTVPKLGSRTRNMGDLFTKIWVKWLNHQRFVHFHGKYLVISSRAMYDDNPFKSGIVGGSSDMLPGYIMLYINQKYTIVTHVKHGLKPRIEAYFPKESGTAPAPPASSQATLMPSEVSDSSFAALMTSHQHPPLNTSTLVPSGSWDMSWTEPSSFSRWLQNPNGRLSSKPRLSTGYIHFTKLVTVGASKEHQNTLKSKAGPVSSLSLGPERRRIGIFPLLAAGDRTGGPEGSSCWADWGWFSDWSAWSLLRKKSHLWQLRCCDQFC